MRVKLAGFNVDIDLIRKNLVNQNVLTPETFSAAYARISRSKDDVTTLRKKAVKDVERARKSNKTIIFGMGHHSVAEHAVFNFDIIGVSRLALEEIEKFRLVSYTEKSQRYVTLDGDYVIPEEIKDKADIEEFRRIVELQNEFYKKSFEVLKEYFSKFYDDPEKKSNKVLIEGSAKEDARYILSLATEGQVGMTINARNLEHLFRRFSFSKRFEVRRIGQLMYSEVKDIAPSIILFPEPSAFEVKLSENTINFDGIKKQRVEEFRILNVDNDSDLKIMSYIIASKKALNFPDVFEKLKSIDKREIKDIYMSLFDDMEFFDSVPREFEFADLEFQAVISASNFAQLKRHRMATLITSDYDIELGNTIPPSIIENRLDKEFKEIIEKTNEVYLKFKDKYGVVADYLLTNSHRRVVYMKMNLREIYHFARLRSDEHAQWDIRNLSDRLVDEVKKLMPYSSMLLCGKGDFIDTFKKIYNKNPKFTI